MHGGRLPAARDKTSEPMSRAHQDTDGDPLEELLVARAAGCLLTVSDVADLLRLDDDWVYAHADELGAVRLGSGKRAPVRFEPATLAARLRALRDAEPARAKDRPPAKRTSRRRKESRAAPADDLLPINDRVRRAGPTRAA
jgi:hypothetical protein